MPDDHHKIVIRHFFSKIEIWKPEI